MPGWRKLLLEISAIERRLLAASDLSLRQNSRSLAYRARTGEPLRKLMPEAFALVREAARRTLDMRHFDTQLIGGMTLATGRVAEMQTGEGKTLTATLPLFLFALPGKRAHLATINDYLAQRDANWMWPVYDKRESIKPSRLKKGLRYPWKQDKRRASRCKTFFFGTLI